MSFFDLQIPFFIPVWRRIILLCVCFGWGLFEFSTGAHFWGILFVGLGAFAAWQLFFDDWPNATSSTDD